MCNTETVAVLIFGVDLIEEASEEEEEVEAVGVDLVITYSLNESRKVPKTQKITINK